ncbi:MAG: magnesium transporter [Lachnospiraceae bacterium]
MEEKDVRDEEEQQFPEKPDYEKELIAIVRSKESDEVIRDRLTDYHDNDIADILDDLTMEERRKLYRILGSEEVSEVFTYVDDIGKFIQELEPEKVAVILEKMDSDDAADVLDELDEEVSENIFRLMNDETRHDIDLIHSYDEDQIGSRMTTNFIVIPRGSSVKRAMRELVTQAAENDNIMTLYVENADKTFYGAIDLKELIVARQDDELEDLIATSYPYVHAKETVDACIEELKDYSEDSIPVLDNEKRLIGVITSEDLVEVVDEEMGEDYAKLAGLTAEEDLQEPLLESMKKRIPWLVTLLALGLIVSSVVGTFEKVVQHLTIVMCFQSLILDMAGNVGTQSLAVTIRVLMDENLTGKQKLFLVVKEMRVGLANGALLGSLSFLFIGCYIMFAKGKTLPFAFAVSACIGVALMVAMVISSLTGTVIPMFFHRIKVDPAVASGPLITTVNDLVAVVTYYGLTWVLLINVLGF